MLSVQPGLRGSNDLRVGRKMATFNCSFSRVGLRTYQYPCITLEDGDSANVYQYILPQITENLNSKQ